VEALFEKKVKNFEKTSLNIANKNSLAQISVENLDLVYYHKVSLKQNVLLKPVTIKSCINNLLKVQVKRKLKRGNPRSCDRLKQLGIPILYRSGMLYPLRYGVQKWVSYPEVVS